MEYGRPKNPRLMPTREDNKGGPVRKRFGRKRFGVRLTHRKILWRKRDMVWTQWYHKEAGRDTAYKHYKIMPMWLDQNRLEFAKVEKVDR